MKTISYICGARKPRESVKYKFHKTLLGVLLCSLWFYRCGFLAKIRGCALSFIYIN